MIALYVVAAVVVLALGSLGVSYNRFVRQRNLVRNAWHNIDTELQRRYDLVPNLVETVRGYATHEAAVFESVAAARTAAIASQGAPDEQEAPERALVGELRGLFAVAERYPDLKASEHFLELQQQLADTEDRIQVARRIYNANVRALNTRVESFPSLLVARRFGFERQPSFEVDAAITTPVVRLQ
ncbi:MAG: LemA family protein [Actinomycetia bacterium]|nr:LemA family protein [Actinomycetes bacterium]